MSQFPVAPPDDVPPARPPRLTWGGWVAWVVVWGATLTVGVVTFLHARHARGVGAPPVIVEGGADASRVPPPDVQFLYAARMVVGVRDLYGATGGAPLPAANVEPLLRKAREQARTQADRLRCAILLADAGMTDESKARFAELASSPGADEPAFRADLELLHSLYQGGVASLAAGQREAFVHRHGWFAELALGYGRPTGDPLRQAAVGPARRAVSLATSSVLGVLAAVVVGVVLLVVAIVLRVGGGLRPAYRLSGVMPLPVPKVAYALPLPPGPVPFVSPYVPMPLPSLPPPPAPDPQETAVLAEKGDPFLEAFALYLGLYLVLSFVLALWKRGQSLPLWVGSALSVAVVLLASLWPCLRGLGGADVRRRLGWHRGRGVLREVGCGLLGYVAGLPIIGLGILVANWIATATGQTISHPIEFEFGRGTSATLQLMLAACVVAPLVEETMFRGALFQHLRRRHRVLASALLVSLLFAAIHPQGWAAIPALGSIAVVLALIREWRGSLIASATAHATNNLIVCLFMLVMLG